MSKMKRFTAALLALICAVSVMGCTVENNGGAAADSPAQSAAPENAALHEFTVQAAAYPQMAPYPDEMSFVKDNGEFDDEGFDKVYTAWREDQKARRNQQEGYQDGLDGFMKKSIQQVLSGADGGNKAYSPVNVFLALAMLAEVTDGNSRKQVLDLVGANNIENLRTQAKAVWNANYCNDGAVTSILASSLWLNQDVTFIPSTMESLANNYYAASFQGEMGSDAFNKALQAWLNEQTGGLLEKQASGVTLVPETIMALATTIYLRAKWVDTFSKDDTEEAVFQAPGGDIPCDFMHQSGTRNYYYSDKFSAVTQPLLESGNMWLLLPDEGVTPEELLQDEKAMDFILSDGEQGESKFIVVNLAMPKFDVASDIDLIPSLQALGVTDIFNAQTSDFSPMTADAKQIFLSQAKHAARVAVDEEGVVAAAFTVMAAAGAAMPPEEEIDFVLDKPFLFAITGVDGLPLFVGIVNQPV